MGIGSPRDICYVCEGAVQYQICFSAMQGGKSVWKAEVKITYMFHALVSVLTCTAIMSAELRLLMMLTIASCSTPCSEANLPESGISPAEPMAARSCDSMTWPTLNSRYIYQNNIVAQQFSRMTKLQRVRLSAAPYNRSSYVHAQQNAVYICSLSSSAR